MKEGTDCGGVRTIDDLMQRCYVDSETGCWHYRLYLMHGRFPQVNYIDPATGKSVKAMGRRAALVLVGKPVLPGHVAFARSACSSEDCVNPDHCRSASKKVWGKVIATSGRMKNLPSKIEANRKIALARRVLTTEQVKEIRISDEPAAKLGKRLGVSSFAVWSVRKGRTHRPPAATSVFNLADTL